MVYRSSYQPFGVEHGESGSEEFRYTGKPEDEASGLYYYGARYYLPEVGRFITADTNLGALSDPQSLNRYIYCRDNPMKYTDPDGEFPVHIAIGAALGAGWNALEYISTHQGKEFDWGELAITAASGAIEGAISFGIGNLGTGVVGKIIAATAGDALSSSVSTAFEFVANGLAKNEDYDYYSSAVDNLYAEPTVSFSVSTPLIIALEFLPIKEAYKKPLEDIIDYASYVASKVATNPSTPLTPTNSSITSSTNYDTSYDEIEQRRTQGRS